MSTEQPTPETDRLFALLWAKDDPPTVVELHEVTKRFRKLERERDEARAALAQAHKDYGFELRDPNGTIWECAAKLMKERDEAREREAKWKAVAEALYYAVGSEMETKADRAFTALRSEVEG